MTKIVDHLTDAEFDEWIERLGREAEARYNAELTHNIAVEKAIAEAFGVEAAGLQGVTIAA